MTQAGEPYTAAERAMGTGNVRTGLKRSLDEEENEDDSEEEEEEEEEGRMDEDLVEVGRGGLVGRPVVVGAAGVGGGKKKMEPEVVLWFLERGDGKVPMNLDMEYLRKSKEASKRGPGR